MIKLTKEDVYGLLDSYRKEIELYEKDKEALLLELISGKKAKYNKKLAKVYEVNKDKAFRDLEKKIDFYKSEYSRISNFINEKGIDEYLKDFYKNEEIRKNKSDLFDIKSKQYFIDEGVKYISNEEMMSGGKFLLGKFDYDCVHLIYEDDKMFLPCINVNKVYDFDSEEMARVIDCFSSKERIEIIKQLKLKLELSARELMELLNFNTTGKLYHHLSFLEKMGVIKKTDEYYSISLKYEIFLDLLFSSMHGI